MGYELEAIIGRPVAVRSFGEGLFFARFVDLGHDVVLTPMTAALIRELHPDGGWNQAIDGFEYLTEVLEARAVAASREGPLAYVEAGYFGGEGSQLAVFWRDGERIASSGGRYGSINDALQMMGVVADSGIDEFDTVGLGRHRRTHRWGEGS